jgi:hypothetical protein
LCCVVQRRLWTVSDTKGRKRTNTEQKWIKGENPGISKKKKSHRGHGCLFVVSVVCCQVEVSATGWSLVQRSPTDCGVSKKCDREASKKMRRLRPPRGCRTIGKNIYIFKPGQLTYHSD